MVEQESQEDSVDNSISITRHKIIFVGDAAVGKTSIIGRIVDNPFNETYENSIGVDFMSKNIRFRGQNIKLQIWDSAGQEKYRGLIPSYVRNSSIVFVVYDVSNRASFDSLASWISFIKGIENTTMVLCGNKLDLPRAVEKDEGEKFAQKEGISFFEVSAKTNENIKVMFYSSVAGLPGLSEADGGNKEGIIKELLEENGVENIPGGNAPGGLTNQSSPKMVVDGQTQPNTPKKKSGCKC